MSVRCFWLEPVGDEEPAVFTRSDTGERITLAKAPAGAMWDAWWMESGAVTLESGRTVHLVVRLPNGHDWMPGHGARNCTRKGQDHDCWCVHGEPPNLTVDKNPALGRSTCQAGAGSIGSTNWHGFLRNGELILA